MASNTTRRAAADDDGIRDRVEIDRAVNGQPARLSASEARIVFWRLSHERGWGPQRIADHLGYSKSRVAASLAQSRNR